MTRQRCRNPGEEQSLLCTAGKITVAPLYHDSEGGRNNTSLIFLMNPFHSRQGTGLQHTGGCSGDLLSCIEGTKPNSRTQQQPGITLLPAPAPESQRGGSLKSIPCHPCPGRDTPTSPGCCQPCPAWPGALPGSRLFIIVHPTPIIF